jgi:hypothetical protein
LTETLSRSLGRLVTLAGIGLAADTELELPEWSDDPLATLMTPGSK